MCIFGNYVMKSVIINHCMFFSTVLHPLLSPSNKMLAGIESHKVMIAAFDLAVDLMQLSGSLS